MFSIVSINNRPEELVQGLTRGGLFPNHGQRKKSNGGLSAGLDQLLMVVSGEGMQGVGWNRGGRGHVMSWGL